MEEPRFPPELEHQIFLVTLREDFNQIESLVLVAKRVHEWIIPEAFKVVVISSDRRFPIRFNLDKFKKYGIYIRSLLITELGVGRDTTVHEVVEYLAFCPNLQDLSIWMLNRMLVPVVSGGLRLELPLRRLSLNLKSILPDLLDSEFVEASIVRKVFSQITHLRITEIPPASDLSCHQIPSFRTLFPNLTHLAVYRRQDDPDILRETARGWHQLRVLVLWSPYLNIQKPFEIEEPEDGDDEAVLRDVHPRVVIVLGVHFVLWEQGAREKGMDEWEFAEGVVKARVKLGEEAGSRRVP